MFQSEIKGRTDGFLYYVLLIDECVKIKNK